MDHTNPVKAKACSETWVKKEQIARTSLSNCSAPNKLKRFVSAACRSEHEQLNILSSRHAKDSNPDSSTALALQLQALQCRRVCQLVCN